MKENQILSANWNPWHGCTKISPGCKYCYVYRQDEHYGVTDQASHCKKNGNFNLPVKRKRDGSYKIPGGSIIYTCFTSDFLLPEADDWRRECWEMMRQRSDCLFYFFTKRIERLAQCLPADWGDGYDNVLIGCTVENQDRADFRLPIFNALPIKHRSVIMAPLLEAVDISPYLNDSIEEVSVGGESGYKVRPLHYDWVLSIRNQCIKNNIPFYFHQTGAYFVKDGKCYHIKRRDQHSQAKKAGINFRIAENGFPETAKLPAQNSVSTLWENL